MRRNIAVAARMLVLGLAFKENCADMRNTKVTDIISRLADYKARVDVYDPWIDAKKCRPVSTASLNCAAGGL